MANELTKRPYSFLVVTLSFVCSIITVVTNDTPLDSPPQNGEESGFPAIEDNWIISVDSRLLTFTDGKLSLPHPEILRRPSRNRETDFSE